MAHLILKESTQTSLKLPILSAKYRIGRMMGNDLCLPENSVSRNHCEIHRKNNTYTLFDLGSLNGTLVNGERVASTPLREGDIIQVGKNILIFHLDEPSESGPEAEPPGSEVEETAAEADLDWAEISRRIDELQHDDPNLYQPETRSVYVLCELSRGIIQTNTEEDLLDIFMDGISWALPFDVAGIFLRDPASPDQLIPKIIRGSDPKNPEISETILKYAGEKDLVLLTNDARTDPRLSRGDSILRLGIHSALASPLWVEGENIGVIYLSTRKAESAYQEKDLSLLVALANLLALGIRELNSRLGAEKERLLRSHLEHYHSPEVVDLILEQARDSGGKIPASVEEITILFADIHNFTGLSEKLSPTETAEILNGFFAYSSDIIFSYQGSLNKFLGDGLMAIFGAPLPIENHAESAIRAALELVRETHHYSNQLPSSRRFQIKVGINTGEAVVGSFGTPKRMEYTALGDAVNIAARLEEIADRDQILISGQTQKMVKGLFPTREIGHTTLRGKLKMIKLFEINPRPG